MPPKNTGTPGIVPRQLPVGTLYPGIQNFDLNMIPNTTTVRPGFPAAMRWPAGAQHSGDPYPGEQGAEYFGIPGHNSNIPRLRRNLFPDILHIPEPANGHEISELLKGLQRKLPANTKVTICPKPLAFKNLNTLNKEIEKLEYGSDNKHRQAYSAIDVCRNGSNVQAGKCTILWLESWDNSNWGQSGVRRDLEEAIREAEREGNAGKIRERQEKLASYKTEHDAAQVTSHTFCAVFVCNNLYIFDPSFPNITTVGPEARGFLHNQSFYTLRQFRLLHAAELALFNIKKCRTVNNVFLGGGGNDNDTCRPDTEIFLRNVVSDLGNMNQNQTEEDIITGIWSSGRYFKNNSVWPISLEAAE